MTTLRIELVNALPNQLTAYTLYFVKTNTEKLNVHLVGSDNTKVISSVTSDDILTAISLAALVSLSDNIPVALTDSGSAGTSSSGSRADHSHPKQTSIKEIRHNYGTGTSFTLSHTNGTIHRLTTSGNTTIALPNSINGLSYLIEVINGGAHTLQFTGGTAIKYPGNSMPVPTGVSGKKDLYIAVCDGSTTDIHDGGRNV